jgi:Bacteriocin-protection, YdeI or OmpD-Associated
VLEPRANYAVIVDHFPHQFVTIIDKYDYGKYFYTVFYLPDEVRTELPLEQNPRLRIEAEINGFALEGALLPDRIGSAQTKHLLTSANQGQKIWYCVISKDTLKRIGKTLGEEIFVALRFGDQNAVEMPGALQEWLRQNTRLQEIWDRLTPGKKRGFAHQIKTAKTIKTREKRLEALEIQLLEL